MIDRETITEYNNTRDTKDKSVLCHAPFTSINFQQNGNANACCYNRSHVLGTYPAQTINQIWFGEKANELRNYIRNNNLEGGCHICQQQLLSRNFANSRAKSYDVYADSRETTLHILKKLFKRNKAIAYPKVIEFELSNTCNLECVMCSGHFSSSIRKNREKKPPLANPYNKEFVNQMKEFIPHLSEAKFLGGEPFLIDIYYELWEAIAQLNPNIKIAITTNGTILNERALLLLKKLNCGIVMSIDSLQKDTYEKIRVNAKFDVVMQNFEWLYNYTRQKNTFMSIAVCPMVANWREIPELLEYCNNKDIAICFNTVFFPREQTLRTFNSEQLKDVHTYYSSIRIEPNTIIQEQNAKCFKDLTNHIKSWFDEKLKYESGERNERYLKIQKYLKEFEDKNQQTDIQEKLIEKFREGFQNIQESESFALEPYFFDFELEDFYSSNEENGHLNFLAHYIDTVKAIAQKRLQSNEFSRLKNNFEIVFKLISNHPLSQRIVIAIVLMPFNEIIPFFSSKSEAEIKELFLDYWNNNSNQ
jgi:MoaA/NifB/PqqE/SkfB family radical SAM enzyme